MCIQKRFTTLHVSPSKKASRMKRQEIVCLPKDRSLRPHGLSACCDKNYFRNDACGLLLLHRLFLRSSFLRTDKTTGVIYHVWSSRCLQKREEQAAWRVPETKIHSILPYVAAWRRPSRSRDPYRSSNYTSSHVMTERVVGGLTHPAASARGVVY